MQFRTSTSFAKYGIGSDRYRAPLDLTKVREGGFAKVVLLTTHVEALWKPSVEMLTLAMPLKAAVVDIVMSPEGGSHTLTPGPEPPHKLGHIVCCRVVVAVPG